MPAGTYYSVLMHVCISAVEAMREADFLLQFRIHVSYKTDPTDVVMRSLNDTLLMMMMVKKKKKRIQN